MKIVIAGAGEVGTHLAKMLSDEHHSIVLLDEDKDKIAKLESMYDIMGVEGSPTSIQDLKEIGMEQTDLFIGVTPIESQNIAAGVLAHQLGARKVLARINNSEYIKPDNQKLFKNMGIDALIYPEHLAAKEITASLRMNWVRQWMEFSNGALTLIGMKVRDNAPIVDQRLMDLKNSEFYRVVAIRRSSETLIPNGSTEIKANDIVYFITTKDFISDVRKQAGKNVIEVKSLMIMGADNMTAETVSLLSKDIDVKIFDKDKRKINKFIEEVENAMFVNDDATNLQVLENENIRDSDAFVALTANSEANILACITAKRFGLQKTIAEIENLDFIELAESLDIGTVINKKILAASYIYQYTLDADVHNVKCLTHVNANVVELTPKEGAPITRGKIMDIKFPNDIFIGGVIRDGKGFIANGQTEIKGGDDVIVFCSSSSFYKLDKLFNG